MKTAREMTIGQNSVVTLLMMMNFSSETVEARRKTKFQMLLEKKWQHKMLYPTNYHSGRKEISTVSQKETVCQHQTYPKKVARGSSLSRKQMIKEGTLEYQEGRKNTVSKNMGKYNSLFFS